MASQLIPSQKASKKYQYTIAFLEDECKSFMEKIYELEFKIDNIELIYQDDQNKLKTSHKNNKELRDENYSLKCELKDVKDELKRTEKKYKTDRDNCECCAGDHWDCPY